MLWYRLIVNIPYELVRKDMDVNEHERLSNVTLRHKLKLSKGRFDCSSINDSVGSVFNVKKTHYNSVRYCIGKLSKLNGFK